uniref:SAM domain-containing protein n=1 Tax=Timema poppense TaxID=170557 RepID=A0A7R9D0N8_TIMPO|nr:unnamed protein product [Timema poppensis]
MEFVAVECVGMEFVAVECVGMEFVAVECVGMEFVAVECVGMEFVAVECVGMEFVAVECVGMEFVAVECVGMEFVAVECVGMEFVAVECVGMEFVAVECVGMEFVAVECVGMEFVAVECVGMEFVAVECVGMEFVAVECVGMEYVAVECVGMEYVAVECVDTECVVVECVDMEYVAVECVGMEYVAVECVGMEFVAVEYVDMEYVAVECVGMEFVAVECVGMEYVAGQYIALEKKYGKAKKLLREFQQREQDLLHREEFHLQLLQEKDTEYNALVKTLKDRVIQLEQELLETQRKAGLPAVLPYDSTSLRQLTPQLSRRHQALPAKPLLQQLETELSDTEISDISPEDGDKTATVERKMPVKEELDRAVPPHELLDVSASKAKAELATRGGLAGRHLPSGKKTAGSGGLSSSGSEVALRVSHSSLMSSDRMKPRSGDWADYTLDESCDNSGDEDQDRRHLYIEYVGREELATSTEVRTQNLANAQSQPQVANRPTSLSPSNSTYSNVISSSSPTSHVHTLVSQFTSAQQPAPVPQYSAVVKQHTHFQSPQPLYSHVSSGPQPLHVHPHPHHVDPWAPRPPASLAEQLKQVLAERERRISGGEQASSQGDLTEMDKGVSQRLVEEIRQAVSEANMRVKKVNPQTLLPPTTQTPWQPQSSPLRDMGPPSPSVSSSGSVSPGVPTADPSPSRPIPADTGDIWLPPHPQDLNSSYSSEKKSSHFWQSAPVVDWSVEQVCQWLLALGLEQHTPKFRDQQVAGVILLQLESRDFKQLGVNGDDKNRLKRKLKELRVQVEKERRQLEKERKEKERLQKKAEKLAEKASKRK